MDAVDLSSSQPAPRDRRNRRRPACQRLVDPLEARRLLSAAAAPTAEPLACTCSLPPTAGDRRPAPAAAIAVAPAAVAPTGPPDLTVKVLALPAGPLQVAGKRTKVARVKVQIANAGAGPAKGNTTLALLASVDATADAGDVTLATLRQKLSLKPGKAKAVTVAFKPTAQTPSGDFIILASVNSAHTIAESNFDNNVAASAAKVTIVNPAIPPGPTFTGSGLASDTTTLVVGTPDQLSLTATVSGRTPTTTMEVDEVDAAGTVTGKLADLFDDGSGLHNDTTANDGVFNNTIAVGYDAPGDHLFVAKVTDAATNATRQTAPVTVSVVPAPTPAQAQQALDTNRALGQQASTALAAGQGASAVLDQVQASLQAMPADQVKPGSIVRSGNRVGWESGAGILSMVDTDLLRPPTGQPAATPARGAPARPAPAITPLAAPGLFPAAETGQSECKRAIVISPFNASFLTQDETTLIRNELVSQRWTVTNKVGNVTPEDFKGLGRYGAVVITSLGGVLPGPGVVIATGAPAGTAAELAANPDAVNHRLVTYPTADGMSSLAVTPRFITAYTGRMDKSIVYVGQMAGAADPTMGNAFRQQGAASYLSYAAQPATGTSASNGVNAFRTLLGVFDPARNTVGDINFIDQPGALQEVGNDFDATLPNTCRALSDYDVIIEYSWQLTQKDLDTNTTFLSHTAGYRGSNDSPYLHWGGDNTSTGGSETTTVDLAKARADGLLPNAATTILLNAGWYTPSQGRGPARISVGLLNKTTGEIKDVVTKRIDPGTQRGLASTPVGEVVVSLSGDPASPDISFQVA
jgi:hypothetical protein